MKIGVIVGNPKPRSRTLAVAVGLAQGAKKRLGGEIAVEVDLALYVDQIFKWPSDQMSELSELVASCDLLVVASPTYKATYTGLLKAFLDRFPSNGLNGVTAIPVMTGASQLHSMSIDVGLRPLLVELGASVPTRGLYFVMSQMTELEHVIDAWVEENLIPGGIIAPVSRMSALAPGDR
jgi:FMN reductase